MEKYLFSDGTNVIREVQSKEELESLLQSVADREKVRIWIFNTSEWLSYAEFTRRSPATEVIPRKKEPAKPVDAGKIQEKNPSKPKTNWFRRAAISAIAIAGVVLIYNFTRITWTRVASLSITAPRPDNVPPVDADSLIQAIELTRNQKLDKITRTNLRIRNTWPERIILTLTAERDSSRATIKHNQVELSIDNATGYQLDDAIVELRSYTDEMLSSTDTFHFRNINYSLPARRRLDRELRADSLAVSIISLKAKSFNFCYADDKVSNYGNLNDRWFCK